MKLENNYHSLTNSVFDNVILILKSMLVGVCAGGIAVLYRLVLGKGESFAFSLYDFVSGNLLWILLLIPIFGILAYLIGKMVDYNPMISGSGIPQIEGILKGYFLKRKSWLSTLVCKFAGGAMGIAGGLSLGREGPSIQLEKLSVIGWETDDWKKRFLSPEEPAPDWPQLLTPLWLVSCLPWKKSLNTLHR